MAVAILGERVDAEDAVQATLVTLWRELPRLRKSSDSGPGRTGFS